MLGHVESNIGDGSVVGIWSTYENASNNSRVISGIRFILPKSAGIINGGSVSIDIDAGGVG